MSGLEFASSIIHSLAWPTAALLAILLLRQPLAQALARPLKRLKVGPGGVEAEYWEDVSAFVQQVLKPEGHPPGPLARPASWSSFRSEMLKLAEVSPVGAILASFAEVETRLRLILEKAGQQDVAGRPLSQLVQEALARGVINDKTAVAIDGLNVMHLLAVQDQADTVDVRRAEEFVTLAEAVLFAIGAGGR